MLDYFFLKKNRQWYVSKLTGLGDVLWWDPACNLAFFKYPPFMAIEDENWESFLKGYKKDVDEKRIDIYALLIKICAAMGTFYEPYYLKNQYIRRRLNEDIKFLIKRVKSRY